MSSQGGGQRGGKGRGGKGRGRGGGKGRGGGQRQGGGHGQGEGQSQGRGGLPRHSSASSEGGQSFVVTPSEPSTSAPRAEQQAWKIPQTKWKSPTTAEAAVEPLAESVRTSMVLMASPDKLTSSKPPASGSTTSVSSARPSTSSAQPPTPQPQRAESKTARFTLPKRNGVGTSGRETVVEVNFLPLHIKPTKTPIAHYDVVFTPDRSKYLFKPAIEAFKQKYLKEYFTAFDGKKNLYSYGSFGDDLEGEVTVYNYERNCEDTYKVTLQIVNTLDLGKIQNYIDGTEPDIPRDVLQAVDVILRGLHSARQNQVVPVGRSFFTPPREGKIVMLDSGMELWTGWFQSTVVGRRPFLNIDVAHKGFPKADRVLNIYDRYVNDEQKYRLVGDAVADFERFLKGTKVNYQIPNDPSSRRTFKVNKLVKSAHNQTFPVDGKQVSVNDYFLKQKNVAIKYPELPLLHVGPPQKTIFVPMELCELLGGQALRRKLTEDQTTKMIKEAATKPEVRKQKIGNAIRQADWNVKTSASAFGISIPNSSFVQIPARVMNAPNLQYADPQATKAPSKGTWWVDRFANAATLSNWTIVKLSRFAYPDKVERFKNLMEAEGRNLGIKVEPPVTEDLSNLKPFQVGPALKRLFQSKHQIYVMIIPPKNYYEKVKQEAELGSGVLTQCVHDKTVNRADPMVVKNILQKVNAKLNGTNHSIAASHRPLVLETPCMIMGADVTHPSPDATDIPSIAAVVASHDPKAVQYNTEIRLQPPREEVIRDFKDIVVRHLKYFFQATKGLKPQRIVYYRDGVSDGQFQQVLAHELTAIWQACDALQPGYRPAITFLVVQKRHHTRLFPIRKEDKEGRNENVPAGTVVDTDIVHPWEMDFYLVSHAGIQGTSRPTKYHVLWDDSELSADELEKMTYSLCHVYMRCTRSVSYPTPTYYAHHAAFRGRVLLKDKPVDLDNLEASQVKFVEKFKATTPMFFV